MANIKFTVTPMLNAVIGGHGRFVFLFLFFLKTPFFGQLCFADGRPPVRLADKLIALKESEGVPPNDVDLYTLAFQEGGELTSAEFARTFEFVVSSQKPSVSITQITSVIASKRRSVTSFKTEFTENKLMVSPNSGTTIQTDYLYAFSLANNCFLTDLTVFEKPKKRDVYSYNGENFFRLTFSEDGTPNLIIDTEGQIANFLLPSAPLQQSMLFDTEAVSMPHAWYDFLHYVSSNKVHVFEKKEMVNGSECVLVASLSQRMCLDPKLNFAVTKIEWFEPVFREGKEDIVFGGMNLIARRVMKDFRDYGNSLYLPTHIENEYYNANGNVTQRDTIHVKGVEINPKLNKNYFTDIAPEDAFVIDNTHLMRMVVVHQSDAVLCEECLHFFEQRKCFRVFFRVGELFLIPPRNCDIFDTDSLVHLDIFWNFVRTLMRGQANHVEFVKRMLDFGGGFAVKAVKTDVGVAQFPQRSECFVKITSHCFADAV